MLISHCCFLQTIVEKFPVNAIQDPTAFMSTEPMDMYNNILVFIIADSSQSSHSPEMQMHIFQVRRVFLLARCVGIFFVLKLHLFN